jgi:hypothetical protein
VDFLWQAHASHGSVRRSHTNRAFTKIVQKWPGEDLFSQVIFLGWVLVLA